MNITLFDEREHTLRTVGFQGTTVQELLEQLTLNPETVLVARESVVLTLDETLCDNDTIEILRVISGG